MLLYTIVAVAVLLGLLSLSSFTIDLGLYDRSRVATLLLLLVVGGGFDSDFCYNILGFLV